MADFHAADLWVAVVPDTSKVGPAMAEAGKQAKGSFHDAVKDFGKTIHDDLDKVSQSAKGMFGDAGRDIKGMFGEAGRDIGRTVRSEIGGAFADIGRDLHSGNISGAFDGIKGKIGDISNVAKNVGVDISGWIPNLDGAKTSAGGMDDGIKNVLNNVTGVSSLFEGMPGKIGAVAGKLGELGVVAAGVLETVKQVVSAIDNIDPGRFFNPDNSYRMPFDRFLTSGGAAGNWDDWIDRHILRPFDPNHPAPKPPGPTAPPRMPTDPSDEWDPTWGPRPPHGGLGWFDTPTNEWDPTWGPRPPHGGLGWFGHPSAPTPSVPRPGGPSPVPTPSAPPVAPSGTRGGGGGGGGGDDALAPTSTPSSRGGGPTAASSSIGTPTDAAGLHAAGSRVANLYAFAQGLVGTPYSTQLRNDCSGMVNELAAVAVGLPPPPSGARFSTPNEGDWLFSHGFKQGMGGPGDLRIGWNPAPGMSGHTAATLPGGEHAEQGGSHPGFVIGPGAAGADSSQFSMHAYLPMGGRGTPGGGTGGPSGPMQMPVGTQHDPVYTAPSSSGGGGGTYEDQGKQLAKGFASGLGEIFGLDGSVFKGFGGGKSPLDFGAFKIFKGFMGLGSGAGGGDGDAADIHGGGGGIGAAISAAVGAGGGTPGGSGGDVHIHGDVAPFNVVQNGVHGDGAKPLKEVANANVPNRYDGLAAAMPGPPG